MNSSRSYSPETPNLGQNRRFFCPMWPWNLKDDLAKTIEHLLHATSSSVHHFLAICEYKLELQSGNGLIVFFTFVTLTFDLGPWPLARTSLLSMVITSNNFMMIPWQEHSEKGATDRQTDGQKEVLSELLGRSWKPWIICAIMTLVCNYRAGKILLLWREAKY